MNLWKWWANVLGKKVGTDRQADVAAALRSFWVLLHVTACLCIIANFFLTWVV